MANTSRDEILSLIEKGLSINEAKDLEKFQNNSLEFSEKIRKKIIEKIRDSLVLSFLMGMDHAESKIELEDIGEIIPEPLSFEEAEKLFKARVPMTKKEWKELEAKLRFRAFTVGRLTELDAIENIRKRVLKVLEEGKTLPQFWDEAGKDELLRRAGFYRGDPWYWEAVFRNNVQTAYNAGRAYQFKKNPPAYLEFVGITDVRQTPICRARSGKIRKADDPWWSSNWPPLHHNCRSTIRAVHREEFEILNLKETHELPKDRPVKGFGLDPIETGSFWKMTDRMIERAIKYGIMDEIEKVTKELGLDIKEIKRPVSKTPKIKNLIDKYEEYNTVYDVEKVIKDFADAHPEMFRAGFGGFKVVNQDYFMATNPVNGIIYISNRSFDNFIPTRDLTYAFQKLKLKQPLTFQEEYAIEVLWHEINHNRVKKYTWLGGTDTKEVRVMEMINQMVSRYTYDNFLKAIGGKASLKAEVIKNGKGYQNYIINFRQLLKRLKINERKFIKEMEETLFEDYDKIYGVAKERLTANLDEEKIDRLLSEINKLPDKYKEKLDNYIGRNYGKRI